MALTIGAGDFFPQVEEALIGMSPGEKKTVVIPVDDAFGEYDEERVFTVSRKDLPDDLNPEVGDQLGLADENDETIGVTVMDVTDDSITFDANHPLAGEDLTFELELIEIL
jgi:peptidylprolyl isomerase